MTSVFGNTENYGLTAGLCSVLSENSFGGIYRTGTGVYTFTNRAEKLNSHRTGRTGKVCFLLAAGACGI